MERTRVCTVLFVDETSYRKPIGRERSTLRMGRMFETLRTKYIVHIAYYLSP